MSESANPQKGGVMSEQEKETTSPDGAVSMTELEEAKTVAARLALINVVAALSALADKHDKGITTLRSNVMIPWKEADELLWEHIRRYM